MALMIKVNNRCPICGTPFSCVKVSHDYGKIYSINAFCDKCELNIELGRPPAEEMNILDAWNKWIKDFDVDDKIGVQYIPNIPAPRWERPDINGK